MGTIRTFLMQNTIHEGSVFYSGAEELTGPTDFGELTPESFIVFADIRDDRLHSIAIHTGLDGGGLLTSHYGKTAWLVGRSVPVAIGAQLADIIAMPELKHTVYEPFFQEIDQLLQNMTEENKEVYYTPEEFSIRMTLFIKEREEQEQEDPQPDPVS